MIYFLPYFEGCCVFLSCRGSSLSQVLGLLGPKGPFRTKNSTASESVFCYRRSFLLSVPFSCLFFLEKQALLSTLRSVFLSVANLLSVLFLVRKGCLGRHAASQVFLSMMAAYESTSSSRYCSPAMLLVPQASPKPRWLWETPELSGHHSLFSVRSRANVGPS